MKPAFPSPEFDAAVADVLHGRADEEQMVGLNALLRADPAACEEYLFRIELHARLGSDPDLFAAKPVEAAAEIIPWRVVAAAPEPVAGTRARGFWTSRWSRGLAAAACLALLLALGWGRWAGRGYSRHPTSTAVAVLAHAVDAEWSQAAGAPAVGAALDPGWLRLKSGLVQVVFYSGARVVVEGPAELRLDSSTGAFCRNGLLSAEVPPQANGFRIATPQTTVVDMGTAFGLNVRSASTEVHVFQGEVQVANPARPQRSLQEGAALAVAGSGAVNDIPLDASAFARASDLLRDSAALRALRYRLWQATNARRNEDPSLRLHLDLENAAPPGWKLPNAARRAPQVADATIVGCQWTEGRWSGKHALGFGTVSDRVRLDVPGEFRSVTLSAWVQVRGLDRAFNAILMADAFDPGEIHWQIRNDGSLDLGLQGGPAQGGQQVFVSPPLIGLERFGQWLHLAAVIDGDARQMVHYIDGREVSRHPMRLAPPFRIGRSELGNWNVGSFPQRSPGLIRHFSGAIDEFALFDRALSPDEIQRLHAEGDPAAPPTP